MCVGDSNTYGQGAPPGSSYPDQLRELLAAQQVARPVVNLGVRGVPAGVAVDLLEQALAVGRPACVVFLAGHNDFSRGDVLVAQDGGLPGGTRPRHWLERLRTVRLAEAAWRVATGDVARAEFGGTARAEIPALIEPERRAAARARAWNGGASGIYRWLAFDWRREDPLARDDYERLLASPDFAGHLEDVLLPLDCHRFELALLAGGAAPLPRPGAPELGGDYARFAAAYAALDANRLDEAQRLFAEEEGRAPKSWRGVYVRVHAAWVDLERRDWSAARARLESTLADMERFAAPRPAERHALAGAALARLFSDPGFRLADDTPARRQRWTELLAEEGCDDGRAWMVAAEWIDALKDAAPAARRAVEERAAPILARKRPATPLDWLAAHRDGDLDGARRAIDLPPPRASWLGVATPFFKDMRPADLERVTAPAFDRLAALARRDGFPLVILTYLDFEKSVPSDCLRSFARKSDFPLVDLEAVYPLTELGADDKRRYFSADRSHPNAAGYGLMARALLPTVRELLDRGH